MNKKSGVLFGEWSEIKTILDENNKHIVDYVVENDRRNSAIPMLDLKGIKARIEPGAIIRDHVEIGDSAQVGKQINVPPLFSYLIPELTQPSFENHQFATFSLFP